MPADSDADLAATLAQQNSRIGVGSPNTYTATVENRGPASADGAQWYHQAYLVGSEGPISTFDVDVVSCVGSGGVACPAYVVGAKGTDRLVWSGGLGVFPSGAQLTVVYRIVPHSAAGKPCGPVNGGLSLTSYLVEPAGVTDATSENNSVALETPGVSVPPCPEADLAVTLAQQNTSIGVGRPNTYTMTVANRGPGEADGARWFNQALPVDGQGPFSTFDVQVVSCSGSGGVTCPSFVEGAQRTSALAWRGVFGAFPSGAKLTVVYRIVPNATAGTPCGAINGGMSLQSTLAAPTGVADPKTSNNQLRLETPGVDVPTCREADLAVTLKQQSPTVGVDQPNTYTTTLENRGPTAADGAHWYNQVWFADDEGPFSRFDVEVVSCVGAGGVACPAFVASAQGTERLFWSGNFGAFPARAKLTVVYRVIPNATGEARCRVSAGRLTATSSLVTPTGVADSSTGNNQVGLRTDSFCHDVSVRQTAAPTEAGAGAAVSFTSRVSTSESRPAYGVKFSDPLPQGLVYGRATCTAAKSQSVCGAMKYDAKTRTVTSTIDTLAASDPITITITGRAGIVPAIFTNTASVESGTGADAFMDPAPASNSSAVTVQVVNTSTDIVMVKTLVGLPSGGWTVPLTFGGEITCRGQGAKPWSVTIPAGATSASAPGVSFFSGDSCTVSENSPAGQDFTGPDIRTPASILDLPSGQTVTVTSESRLAAQALPPPPPPPSASPVTAPADPRVTDQRGNGDDLAGTGGPDLDALGLGAVLMLLGGSGLWAGRRRRRRGRPIRSI